MKLQVLGPVGARNGETQVALGGPRQRAVLAVLVAFANEAVSSDRLIGEVWGEAPPAAARNSLQSMVSNLRKALKPDSRITIDGEGRGYVLRVPSDAVDSLDFAVRVDEARRLIGGDVDAGVRQLRGALELWRGAPFGDLADEIEVLRAEGARLEELRMRALESRIEGELAMGGAADLVGELEGLIEAHPLREGLSRLLMVALQLSGRQAEALRVASELRRVLAEEIGIEPSPELVRLEQEILDQSVEAPAATVAANPYRGLESFMEADAARFFGRENLTERLLARWGEEVEGCRLLAVVGASGSGKSSVVRAGLVPALRTGAVDGSQDWVVVQMVPGVTPLRDLETALLRVAVNPPPTLLEQLTRDELGLRDAVNRILPDDGSELLLVVDQFEELFTIADPEEAAHFIDAMVGAVTAPASRVRVVLTLRADFYDRPLGHRGLAPLLAQRMETVVEMTPDELSQAIVGPAELAGVAVEPGLVAAVVADATGQPGALPMVQYALTELFEHRDSDTLTLAGYHELGGVRGAIRRRAENLYDSLDETQQASVRNVLLQLVTLGEGEEDTRRRVARDDLTGDTGVIDAFSEARLVSLDQDPATERATVEVAHEALLREWPRLGTWIDESRDDIRTHRRLQAATKEWVDNQQAPSYLLTGERLASFQHWRNSTNQTLTPTETGLLEASDQAVAAEQRRRATTRRRVLASLAAATLVSVILAAVALIRTGQANEQTRIAEVRELAGSALAALETDPELALLLALEAVDREPLPEAQEALHQAIAAQRVTMTIRATGGAATYLNQSTIAALNDTGTITIYDVTGSEPRQTATIGTPGWLATARTGTTSTQMVAVDRGSILAVGSADGFLHVIDVASGVELWERKKIGERSPQISATLDGSVIAARAWVELGVSVGGGLFATSTGAHLADIGVRRPGFGSPGVAITKSLPADQATLILDGDGIQFVPIGAPESNQSFSSNNSGEIIEAGRTRYLSLSRNDLGEVIVFAAGSDEVLARYQGHKSDVWDLDMDHNEVRAVSGGADGTARIWSMLTGHEQLVLPASQGGVISVDLNPDGSRLLTVGSDGLARIWDVSSQGGAEVAAAEHGLSVDGQLRDFFRDETDPIHYTAFSSDAANLVVRAIDEAADTVVFDVENLGRRVVGHSAGHSTAVSPDGIALAIGRSGGANEYDLEAGGPPTAYGTMRPETESPRIAYSADGRRLAIGSSDGLVEVFDTMTQSKADTFDVGQITSLLFDEDGQVVTTDEEGHVRVWEDGTGTSTEMKIGSRVGNAAIHDNRIIASDFQGSWSAVDLEDGSGVYPARFAHAGGINWFEISRVAPLMATAGRDGTIKVWDLGTGTALMTLAELGRPVSSLAISPDGTLLAAVDSDVVHVYTLDVDRLVEIGRSKVTRSLTGAECRQYLRRGCADGR